MSAFTHFGLFFGPEHVRAARRDHDRSPLREAWARLQEPAPAGALAAAHWDGLRWRFSDDLDAGERAVQALQQGAGWEDAPASSFEQCGRALALAQTFEMVRDHPAFPASASAAWLEQFADYVAALSATPPASLVEQIGLGAVAAAAGVVLERSDLLEAGADIFRRTVRDEVRPEGYLPALVEAGDGRGMERQLQAVAALTLTAEAAAQAGLDLWGYSARGVSLVTAGAYLIYYYYYPEAWRWDAGQTPDAPGLFRRWGGFLEMLNRRARPRDIRLLLDELRPIYQLDGGGLTTLTHGVSARRGWFG